MPESFKASTIAAVTDCHEASEAGRLNFPQILAALAAVGIEGYSVDYRRSTRTYYQPDGDSLELSFPPLGVAVAEAFDAATIQSGIREAQTNAPGYTYHGFCRKVMAAGCAGYVVSLLGRRVVYFGRTAETHVELMPG